MTWPFATLRMFGYGLILADPPWQFELHSDKGEEKSPQAQYACMPTDAIAALPAGHLASRDAVLALWATIPMLPDALTVMRAWGFQYKSAIPWAKQSRSGRKWAFGTGYIFRSAAELLLIGTTGAPAILSKSERNLIVAPVREHSRKPADQYRKLQAVFPGPYVELFARARRPGWDSCGNQVGKFEETAE